VTWWKIAEIDPTIMARALWLQTHPLRTGLGHGLCGHRTASGASFNCSAMTQRIARYHSEHERHSQRNIQVMGYPQAEIASGWILAFHLPIKVHEMWWCNE
jgi:hypothetical protein